MIVMGKYVLESKKVNALNIYKSIMSSGTCCIKRALLNTQNMFFVVKVERGMNSSTLSLQQCCPIAPHPQPPPRRGGEGLITVLSRNWSIFNSSGELTGTSTQWHLTVLSGLKPAWVVVKCGGCHKSPFSPKSWFYCCMKLLVASNRSLFVEETSLLDYC